MKARKILFRLLAIIICVGLWIGWGFLCAVMDFKHGGGYLLLGILCCVMVWIWKLFGKLADKTSKKEDNPQNKKENTESTKTSEQPSSLSNYATNDGTPNKTNTTL